MFGVITALPKEYAAVRVMLEDAKDMQIQVSGTTKRFTTGTITSKHDGGKHEIALAVLSIMGTNAAAIAANMMGEAFREKGLEAIIMVGIAGGTPNPNKPEDHVRLGDIVISSDGGVVQYDNIKTVLKAGESRPRIEIRSHPRPPSAKLLEAVKLFNAESVYMDKEWIIYISEGQEMLVGYERPDEKKDILYDHQENVIEHPIDKERISGEPKIHLGKIGSANTLLKNPDLRDELRDQQGVRAIEMEASGVADATWVAGKEGYLVIRGICDYCDPSKNDEWQNYAALVAAAYFKGLIESIPGKITPRFYAGEKTKPEEDDFSPVEHNRYVSPLFVGRGDFIKKIMADFDTDPSLARIAFIEKGGIGKTALAAQIAEEYRRQPLSTDRFVFFADLKNETPSTVALRWLKYFGLDYEKEDESTRLNTMRMKISNTPSIVIIDNCQNRESAQKLLITSQNVVSILTTRDSNNVPPEFAMESVEELDSTSAALLIQKLIGIARCQEDPKSIEDICKLCGGIPLALLIAGSELKHAARWRNLNRYLDKLRSYPLGTLSPGATADQSIRATFEISYENLGKEERVLFDSLGCFSGNEFSGEAADAIHHKDTEQTLEGLCDKSLISEYGDRRFGIHDLMLQYAKEKISGNINANQWKIDLLQFYSEFTLTNSENYEKLDIEISNILGLLFDGILEKDSDLESYYIVLQNIHRYLKDRGYWTELLQISERSYSRFKNAPVKRLYVVTWLLSWIYYQQSNFEKTYEVTRDTLSLYEDNPDPTGKAGAKRRLGMASIELGKLDEAKDWLDQAKTEFEALDMPLKVGDTLCFLAILERKKSDGDEELAQRYLEEALELVKTSEKEVGMILYNIGRLKSQTGDLEGAIRFHLQSLAIDEKIKRKPGIAYNNFRIGQIEITNPDKKEEALSKLNIAKDMFFSLGNTKRVKQIDVILDNNK